MSRSTKPLPLAELADEICTLSAHLNAATARFLRLVAEFDEREGWGEWGAKSCAHWLSWRCCLSLGTAREHVRVARRMVDLPVIAAAFDSGELSFSQARALTRVENVVNEAELLELARAATAAQLESIVRGYRRVTGPLAARAHQRRFLSITYDDDGGAVLRGRLAVEEAAVLERALHLAREELWAPERDGAVGDDSRSDAELAASMPEDGAGAARMDALICACDGFLAGADGSRTGGDRHQVVVHVDAAALAGGTDGGLVDGHTPVAAAVVERLCCDASLVVAVERDGKALSVGRKTRSIPPAVRRALDRRDGGCTFPGCTQRRHVDAHHVEHWARGGETSVDNLVQLCRHHHRLVHEGGFSVGFQRREAVFRTPSGRRLRVKPRARRGDLAALEQGHRRAGLALDATTGVCRWTGEPLHLGDAVEAMLAFAPA